MLYLFDDLLLDKIIPKNNDRTKKAEPYLEIWMEWSLDKIKHRPLTLCNFPSTSFHICTFIYRLHIIFVNGIFHWPV
jgi:hypothetical protein